MISRLPDIIEPDIVKAAERINAVWRKSVENIIETGTLLAVYRDKWAKEHPGKWARLIGNNQWKGQGLLQFGASYVYKLIKISNSPRLMEHVPLLPSDTLTLYNLSRLSDERFAQLLSDGRINPGMKRSEASAASLRR